MNNKVVYALYKAFSARGFSTLRFNFRGVGRSEGAYTGGEGELSDAASALDWLQATNPSSTTCWIIGFSFGAWIGMQLLMRRPELNCFVSVSPPADKYDFNFLAPCPVSGMIVQGGSDEIVSPESVHNLAIKLKNQKGLQIDYSLIEKADHFFAAQMPQFRSLIDQYISKMQVNETAGFVASEEVQESEERTKVP